MATVKLDPAKGIQIPNLTTTERNAISSPETGAIIWNTTTSEINQYNGSAWEITYTPVAGITSSADATAITINSSENVGIGVVPEVTHPTHDALQVGGNGNWSSYGTQGASGEMDFQHNAYYAPSGNDKYISTDEATKYRQGGGIHKFYTAPSGSADAAITWTQRVRIDSDGLKFNNDSASDNALDDYEEGTWTPVFSGSDTAGTYTYSQQHGNYIKIGKMVTIWFSLFNISASSSGAGNIRILGVPFSVNSDPHRGCVGTLELDDFTFSGSLSTTVESGMTYITPRQSISGNNDSILQVSNRSSNVSDLCGCITYMAA